jgi:hypothetical protein
MNLNPEMFSECSEDNCFSRILVNLRGNKLMDSASKREFTLLLSCLATIYYCTSEVPLNVSETIALCTERPASGTNKVAHVPLRI